MNQSKPRFASLLPCHNALLITAILVGASAPLSAAVTWVPNIPDTYQHQRWGARPGGPVPIAGGLDVGGDRLEMINSGGNQVPLGWEVAGFYNPPFNQAFFNAHPDVQGIPVGRTFAIAKFSGWCNYSSYTNQFYHYKQLKKPDNTPLFPNIAGSMETSDELHNEVKKFVKDLAAIAPVPTSKTLNLLLAQRLGKNVKTSITAQNYQQGPNGVKFMSAINQEKILPTTFVAQHLKSALTRKATAALQLRYEGTPVNAEGQSGLWWKGNGVTNIHSVTVAGYDPAGNGTIWFADPDSNPTGDGAEGNTNDNAGWTEGISGIGNWSAAASDNWLAAAGNGLPAKQRRYTGADVPKPAGAEPTEAERKRLYYEGKLAPNHTEFAIGGANGGAGYKRYNGVRISYLETLEVKRFGVAPFIPGVLGDGDPLSFQVSPGQEGAGIINEFLLAPASVAESILAVTNLRLEGETLDWAIVEDRDILLDGLWNIYFFEAGSQDWWGNTLPYGGVSIRAGEGVADLIDLDVLEFDYATLGGVELTAWDALYNDRHDLTGNSVGVQVEGGGYELSFEQTPEPSSLCLLATGVCVLVRRRRN